MAEKIGLEAVFSDAQFKAGIANYNIQIQNATIVTDKAAKQVTQSTQKMSSDWDAMAKKVGDVLSIYMVKKVGEAVLELGELGATAIRQRAAFEELAQQAGGSSDEILAALKRATDGTVAQTDIILAANRGILLGLGAQADQWEQLAEVARFRARAMGLSVTQALNDITTGIGRQSRLILDNLGIILDTEQVYADYAASIGTTADALDDAQKKQALMTAVISEGQEQIAAAGGIISDYGDEIERMNASLADAKTQLAEAVAPAVADVAAAVSDATPKVVETAKQLGILAEAGLKWVGAALTGADATAAFNASMAESIGILDDLNAAAAQYESRRGAVVDTIRAADEATTQYEDSLRSLQTSEENLAKAEESRFKKRAALVAEQRKAEEQAAKEIAKEAEKAEQERVRAQERALDEMRRNEEQYASALKSLFDQITAANQQAMEDRAQAERDLARQLADLDRELAREREKIQRDLERDLKDLRRKNREDRIDAERKLNRTLEDLQTRAAQRNAATWRDYYADLEVLEAQHAARLQSITDKYAGLRGDIEKKYATEQEKDRDAERDTEREALLEQLRKLLDEEYAYKVHGYEEVWEEKRKVLQDQLDALKQEELDLLAQQQAAEEAQEQAAFEARQAQIKQQRDQELEATQLWYDEQIAAAKLAYERQMEDLRISLEREIEERKRAAKRALDDLRRRGDAERAELQRQFNERINEINRALAAQTQAFRDAYNNELRDLQTYLNQRMQQWRDHLAAVEALLGVGSPSKWMMNLGQSMREGLTIGFDSPRIATELKQAVAGFERAASSLALPMGGGGGSTNITNITNHNLGVTANYQRAQPERSLRDDLGLYNSMLGMRARG